MALGQLRCLEQHPHELLLHVMLDSCTACDFTRHAPACSLPCRRRGPLHSRSHVVSRTHSVVAGPLRGPAARWHVPVPSEREVVCLHPSASVVIIAATIAVVVAVAAAAAHPTAAAGCCGCAVTRPCSLEQLAHERRALHMVPRTIHHHLRRFRRFCRLRRLRRLRRPGRLRRLHRLRRPRSHLHHVRRLR